METTIHHFQSLPRYGIMVCILLIVAFFIIGSIASAEEWQRAEIVHCEEWVSLRQGPDPKTNRLAKVPLGSIVEAMPYNDSFAYCRYNDKTGYILNEYLKYEDTEVSAEESASEADPTDNTWVLPNVSEYLSMRERPSENASVIKKIKPGERMQVLGWDGLFCRVRLESSGVSGWVHSGYLKAEALPKKGWPYDYAALLDDISLIPESPSLCVEILETTEDDRNIFVIRFGEQNASHHILVQANMHAREIMTGKLAMDLLLQLISDHPDGLDDICFHILPMVNPDGVDIAVNGADAIHDQKLQKEIVSILKNERIPAGDWKANARGVDLNRNFDAGWEKLKVRTPGSQRYRGESPLSERESKALASYVEKYPFAATISLHSKGSLIYWLGAQDDLYITNKGLARCVEKSTGYHPVDKESDVEKGGFKDWALEKKGIPSLTIEIGARGSTGTLEEYSVILIRCKDLLADLGNWVVN